MPWLKDIASGADAECRLLGAREAKARALLRLLGRVSVHQLVAFCNGRQEGQALAARLQAAGFPATFISGALPRLPQLPLCGSA